MLTAAQESVQIDVERMLDGMQASRDFGELREMNGKSCGGKQINFPRRYKSMGIDLGEGKTQ